ncbi:hypothetical protein [Rhodanobacter sp. MP1X3]|uniref:hypothetical protein n=1 Tax=Rhodanobacter sp. MP1X3 TaxID=2723086 RepID=UPI0016086280|nr:hypothetical protein [Rhodanobacter sp. MP1X3]MBB6242519.1 hypothetical protein [Rhodanobacter sp. MP1X3]
MKVGLGKSSSLHESSYRVAVLVVVISCHLGLLMLLLRPAIFYRDTTPVERSNPLVLKLRFFQPPRPSSPHLVSPALHLIAAAVRIHTALSGRPSKPLAVQQAAHLDAQSSETHLTSAPTTPDVDTSNEVSTSDGGFQQRLLNAQHSYAVHGVPGSDTSSAPGIHLIDPMNQGIGAVARTTQRAFGIKDSHCIDVDVWRGLTPQELSARHISPSDVDKVDEKYDCNRPPGLSF